MKKNKIAFTLAEENCQVANSVCKFGGVEDAQCNCKAFTLAEVLITLAIIGIVSALVIPSVLKNYNDKKYNTARLKALKTFGEAGKLASINDEMNSQANATDFVNNVLFKYLKITKVCDNLKPQDCGFPTKFKSSSGSNLISTNYIKWNQLGIYAPTNVNAPINEVAMSKFITTNDGFSALIHYNPKCGRTNHEITYDSPCKYKGCPYRNIDAACMNVIYDMNGTKNPNRVGEDIGIVTTFWSGIKSISVAPGIVPYSINTTGTTSSTFANAPDVCAQKGTNKILYTMPSIDELTSLYINAKLTSMPNGKFYWSSTRVIDSPGNVWGVHSNGNCSWANVGSWTVWCVRR